MVERRNKTARRPDIVENRPFPIYEPSPRSRRDRNPSERPSIDDVIGSLSDAYENQRARQVVEWVRQQGTRRAAV
jgi:hypothetical protein